MKTVFISNYINHHQIPFSDALYEKLPLRAMLARPDVYEGI